MTLCLPDPEAAEDKSGMLTSALCSGSCFSTCGSPPTPSSCTLAPLPQHVTLINLPVVLLVIFCLPLVASRLRITSSSPPPPLMDKPSLLVMSHLLLSLHSFWTFRCLWLHPPLLSTIKTFPSGKARGVQLVRFVESSAPVDPSPPQRFQGQPTSPLWRHDHYHHLQGCGP